MFSYSDSKETLCRPPVQRIFWRVSYGVNRTIAQSNDQVLHTALVINKSVYQLIMHVILALGHRYKRRRRREREREKKLCCVSLW